MHDPSTALHRFGLGARAGEAPPRDPRAWLLDQLRPEAARPPALGSLPSSSDFVREWAAGNKDTIKSVGVVRYAAEVDARARAALTTSTPFVERWVRCWSNHFTVSVRAVTTFGFVGPYEREVVRAGCMGRFADLLLASCQHPGMILYLDNQKSSGPDAPGTGEAKGGRGRRRRMAPKTTGLNENLAREILELHTLGADGGYTQDDVRALAGLLTGWTFDKPATRGAGFYFAEERHQPGPFVLLGKTYKGGLAEGERAIRDLAAHPATAHNVARRVARHFGVVDGTTVGALASAFSRSGGDLREVARALVDSEAAWTAAPFLGQPDDWLVTVGRASGLDRVIGDLGRLGRGGNETEAGEESAAADPMEGGRRREKVRSPWLQLSRFVGQPVWGCDSPEGWPDDEASWAGPEQVLRRVEIAQRLAARLARGGGEVLDGALDALGPRLAAGERRAVERAGDRATALALCFLSPGVMRR